MPIRIGMPTKKTIVVPCIVKSRLNACGDTIVRFGYASCIRMIVASRPPITRKTSA